MNFCKTWIILFFVLFSVWSIQISIAFAEVLTLSDGLTQAVEKSRFLKISGSEEMIAEADSMTARSKLLPSINVSSGFTYLAYQPGAIFGPTQVYTSEKNFISYSLVVQQTLFDFMGNASKYEATKMMLNTKKLETFRVKNLVAVDFVMAYLDLLESEKTVSIAKKEVEMIESHRRDARNLFDEGVITKNELLQAEIKLSDAKQKLLTANNFRVVNKSRINSLLQRPLFSELQVQEVGDSSSFSSVFLSMDSALAIAEQERAEIKIADMTMKALNLEERSKKSDYLPKLFLKGGYDFTENRYQLHEGNWSVTLGMNLNLFHGGATRSEVLKIEHQKQELIEKKHRLIDEIRLEVQKYIMHAATAREKVAVTKGAIQQAEENLRINRVKYEEGVATGTEVLDAITLLTLAENNFYHSLYELRKAEAAIAYSIGKDLAEVYR